MWVIQEGCYYNLPNIYHAQHKVYIPGYKQAFLGFSF